MLYIIESTLTKTAFIDEKRNAYIYANKKSAEEFSSKVPDTQVREFDGAIDTGLLSACFAAGAMFLKERNDGWSENVYDLYKSPKEKRFYNEDLNANVARYLHTRNECYLKELKNCSFIIPVRITNEPYIRIVYPTLYKNRKTKDEYAFIAFTDMTEYDKWTEKDNDWRPLLIDSETMARIGKKHRFILDVYRTAFHITNKMMRKYMCDESDEEDL